MNWEEMRDELVSDLERMIKQENHWKTELQKCDSKESFMSTSIDMTDSLSAGLSV